MTVRELEAAVKKMLAEAKSPSPDNVLSMVDLRTSLAEYLEELDEVFGTRGSAAHCWCQFDRMPVALFETLDDAQLRDLLAVELRRAPAPGVVATLEGERVGWCSVAPPSARR